MMRIGLLTASQTHKNWARLKSLKMRKVRLVVEKKRYPCGSNLEELQRQGCWPVVVFVVLLWVGIFKVVFLIWRFR